MNGITFILSCILVPVIGFGLIQKEEPKKVYFKNLLNALGKTVKIFIELIISVLKWLGEGFLATIQGIINGIMFFSKMIFVFFRIIFGLSLLAFLIFIALLIILKVIKFVWFF